jgi:hypothetical protein
MATLFYSRSAGPVQGGLVAITKSDSTVYDPPLRGIYVGGNGDLAITHADSSTAVLVAVSAGTMLPVSNVSKVLSTGTTATNIVGWKA